MNQRSIECLLNRLSTLKQENITGPRHGSLCEGNPPVTSQSASNAKNISIWWRHNGWHRRLSSYQPSVPPVTRKLASWWRHQMGTFPRYWPFVWRIHRSPANSSHKGQWRGAVLFSRICAWINGWVNNREAVFLSRYRAHYDVIMMIMTNLYFQRWGFQYLRS